MMEYLLNYMAMQGVYASSQREQELLESGIDRYLLENGIGKNDTGEYYRNYLDGHLKTISLTDLKSYFMNYSLISDVNQIVIEYQSDGEIQEERKKELYQLMEKLHSCGLGEKYIPIIEVKQILGRLS